MDVKRLVILVEGDSELKLMNGLVIPELYKRLSNKPHSSEWSLEACKIVTNRQLNKKGGNVNYEYLKNDVKRFSAQGCAVITTFLDFFRLPVTFPGYTTDGSLIGQVEQAMEQDLRSSIPNLPRFIPYIQKYEYEALLFADIVGFEYLLDEQTELEAIKRIMEQYPNPEDINGGNTTAPSKRLSNIFNYNKTSDSNEVLTMIGFDTIYGKCPRFKEWFDKLEDEIL